MTSGSDDAIAVVGVSCRLPGAPDSDAFWELLREGRHAITEIPAGRWDALQGMTTRYGAFVDAIDMFDADFFGISPRESVGIDPQQRLMLELSWEAFEDAGIVPETLRDSDTGVFVGVIWDDYARLLQEYGPSAITAHTVTGVHRGMIANRISYTLGLHGPSLIVDAAQSSSLVAVHTACESLRTGESTLALVGGVSLNILPESALTMERFGGLSPDGRCFTFDARANGFVRGEGGAAVVLKPLSRALTDGDQVYCVIAGSAVNNDGATPGFTVPSADQQEKVIRAACKRAGTAPDDVQYVELHGTGTKVGDPIEAAALGAALGSARRVGSPLMVGSVKTNIGHLEGAAGIAGLLKTVLSIHHRVLPPSLNFQSPNPSIPLSELNLEVNTAARAWPAPHQPLTAGVSSFGMGGTNCHVVLSEPPSPQKPHALDVASDAGATPTAPILCPVSGKTDEALRAQADRLETFLAQHADSSLSDVAFSLATARSAFAHRAVIIADSREDLRQGLRALAHQTPAMSIVQGTVPEAPRSVVFVFPGQGAQYPGMGSQLYDRFPVFARALDEVCAALDVHLDVALRDVMFSTESSPTAELLDQTGYAQPALFAFGVALYELFAWAGAVPDCLLGHSIGELTAAYVAGVLSLHDAAILVTTRGRLMQSCRADGIMIAIQASEDEVLPLLDGHHDAVSVAAVNSHTSTVLSGDPNTVEKIRDHFTTQERKTTQLRVSHAFHSPHMDAALEQFGDTAAGLAYSPPTVNILSNLTGQLAGPDQLTSPDYWTQHLRHTVRFADSVQTLLNHGPHLFLELSPHPVLTPAITDTINHTAGTAAGSIAIKTLHPKQPDTHTFTTALAQLHCHGHPLNWPTLNPTGQRTNLPTYPFQRQRHWLDVHDLPARGRRHATPDEMPDKPSPDAETDDRPGSFAARLAGMPEAERDGQLVELVRSHSGIVLGHVTSGTVHTDRTFRELGFDSTTAVELSARLSSAIELPLPATLIYDHPTPRNLARFLRTELLGGPIAGATPAHTTTAINEPIAIVGMGCRCPGAVVSPEDLWRLVSEGKDAIGKFPDNRGWDIDSLYDPDLERPGTCYVRAGGFVYDADEFDAEFFGISPREAAAMDPQQRLVLETAWETVESAGMDPSSLRGSRTAVFVGTIPQDYGVQSHPAEEYEGYLLTGRTTSVLSGRVAYLLGLEGPAVTVDTACSSSLVALHLAVQALRRGECGLAVAGGVTVLSTPEMFTEFSRQRILAPDGRCKPFAAAADGIALADGVGLLALQRLSDARRDGRRVLAVVRGSAVNSDGASNGLTAPNGPAQERVIRQALADAGLSTTDIDVVEAHGTGTRLGDPIEAQAILATYGQNRPADRPVWLGSVKSNIGHPQAAAGVLGVLKMVQAIRHGSVPRTLHVDAPSRHVDWSSGTVMLPTENTPWPDRQQPRRAGISSFGISGTNAHMIIEEAEKAPADSAATANDGDVPDLVAWTISAHNAPALRTQAQRLASHIAERPHLRIADLGYSLAATRASLNHRAVVLGRDRAEFRHRLDALARGTLPDREIIMGVAGDGADLAEAVFVFPGQGGQRLGMGLELHRRFPAYADAFDDACAALQALTGWSVRDVLEQRPDAPPLDRVDIVQPALFAVMVSLAALWRSVGVRPAAVIGHSQGEIAAAYVAGALTLADAARVVVSRSRALTTLIGAGTMASILLPAQDVVHVLRSWNDRLAVAAVNGPNNTTVSGDAVAVDELLATCDRDGIDARRIPVDYPSHTTHVERIRDPLLRELADLAPQPATIPFYSTVDGEPHSDPLDTTAMTADYWYRNLRHSVQFTSTVPAILDHGLHTFVEVSPHPILVTSVQNIAEDKAVDATVVGSLRREQDEACRFLGSMAELWVRGMPVSWRQQFRGPSPQAVDLPTYAFQRRRHWLEPAPRGTAAADLPALGLVSAGHPMLGASIELADGGGHVFTGRVSLEDHPWLADHRIGGEVLIPGVVWLDLALHAGTQIGCGTVEELVFETRLPLPEPGAVQLELAVGAADETGRRAVSIHSRPEGAEPTGPWTCHARGTLTPAPAGPAGSTADLATWPVTGGQPLPVDDIYRELGQRGYGYGPAFTGLRHLWRHGADTYAEVALDDPLQGRVAGYGVFPALLDAALHATLLDHRVDPDQILLPFSCAGVTLAACGATRLRIRITRIDDGSVSLLAVDSAGQPVIDIEALRVQAAPRHALRTAEPDPLYLLDWVATPAGPQPAARPGSWWSVIGDWTAAVAIESAGGVEVTMGDTLATLAAECERRGRPPDVVVVPAPTGQLAPPVALLESVRAGVCRMLTVLQQWLADEHFDSSRLVVVTRGGVTVADGPHPDLAQASIWGLIRSAQSEHPGRITLIDVDPAKETTHLGVMEVVAAAVAADDPQVAVRGAEIVAPRLIRAASAGQLAIPAGQPAWRLDRLGADSLSDVVLVAHPELLAPLAPGQVRIAVRAAGLNFKDVLVALGMVDAEALGIEGAGTVVDVADDVTGVAPGDQVFGIMAGAFGSLASTDQHLLAQIPAHWSFEQAASIPVAFATAYYCLADVAELRAGESVLIHAGTGAVGMAAIQLARHRGAEVYATASHGKHDALRSMGLDDNHIADSRNPDFAARFRTATAGRGVDVVVNSLSGRLIDAGLELLAAGGRFVEIGKTDIRDADAVAAAYPGVSYYVFDLLQCDPRRTGEILAEVTDLYQQTALAPLAVRAWDVRQAPEALRFMSQARHIGKLVLTVPSIPSTPSLDGTILITGGTGTLGGLVATHLVSHYGVRNLILVSRRGPAAEGADRLQDQLRESGARVDIMACDIADRAQVAEVIARIPAEHPLIGVVHTAVTLDDGLISDLSAERMEAVFRAKVHGALHLHELTRDMDLSMFVLFSSVSGLVGMPGQGNYAAANVTLDALAQWRRALGLAGVSVAWGLWAQESGATAGLSGASRARFRRAGLLPLSTSQALRLFDQAIRTDASAVAAIAVDPRPVASEAPPILRGVVRTALGVADNATAQVSGLAQRLAGLSQGDSERLVLDVVRQHAGVVLGHGAADELDLTRAFKDQGFDSLTAVELRNRLAATTGLRLPPTMVFDHPTPTILARYLRTRLTGDADTTHAATAPAASAGTVTSEPVAIVGVGCRFPGGVISAETLWELVAEGRDAVETFPTDRGWDLEHLFDSDPNRLGTSYTQAGAFLDDAAGFDASFFGISPREAIAMDPQQRLLLELAWEALEHAGIDPTTLRGSNTGVFAGVYSTGHDVQAVGADSLAGHLITGSATSVASGRIAYALGLEGPAISVDTACSSSLVATHLADQALRRGECDLALAGGATVLSTPQLFIGFSRQRGLARDGRCKAFSSAADGMGVGEGAGLVVLERLSDARRHRHPVLAVIAGSAVNQDGASNGLTAPNGPSQQRVIRHALADARLSTTDVDVVEAHGTGTVLGDPIEADALLTTYGQGHSPERPLWLGSLKSNIAHTQAAAGIAGVIKMTQAIQHGVLPKTLYTDQPSPHVDWSARTVQLLTQAREWPNTHRPRRAGVSSFGISGTNAHLILEQAPPEPAADQTPSAATGVEPSTLIWPISARTQPALAAQAARVRERIVEDPGLDLTDLAYSLAVTRTHHPCRAVITHALTDKADVGEVRKDLLEALRALAAGQHNRHLTSGLVPRGGPGKVVFVFPGQGAQYPGMGSQLYDRFPVFARALDEVCAALDVHLDVALRDVMFSTEGSPTAELLDQTGYAQPALFAFGVALYELFAWAGAVPDCLLGHSIGELTAAYVAGVLSLHDAAILVTTRGRLMQSCRADGIMIAIQASEDEVLPLLDGHHDAVSVAAVNSHTSTVLSGDPNTVEKIRDHFTTQERKTTQLRVSHAFHSPHMDAALEQFGDTAAGLAYSPPTVNILSNLTGQLAGPDQLTSPDYWTQHLRHTVRFADSVQTLLNHGPHLFLELSPHPVLTPAITDTINHTAGTAAGSIAIKTLHPKQPDTHTFTTALAQLHCHGHPLNWPTLNPTGQRTNLPTYPFQHRHYWLRPTPAQDVTTAGLDRSDHPLLSAVIELADNQGWVFTGMISLRTHPWLGDHVIAATALFPAAGFLELALHAGNHAGCRRIEELAVHTPLPLQDDSRIQLRVTVHAVDDHGRRPLSIHARTITDAIKGNGKQPPWILHAAGIAAPDSSHPPAESATSWPPAGSDPIDVTNLYERLVDAGARYGPVFQGVKKAWLLNNDVCAEISLPGTTTDATRFAIHPALLNAALHAHTLVNLDIDPGGRAQLPSSFTGVSLHAEVAGAARAHLASTGRNTVALTLFDTTGRLVAVIDTVALATNGADEPH